jgi:hypothetical protein
MSFAELRGLLIKIVTSWQVIVATVVVVLYFFLVFYVARLRYEIRSPAAPRSRRAKKAAAAPAAAEAALESDDLGIEEEG